MFGALFELIYGIFRLVFRNTSDLASALFYLGELIGTIIGVLYACLPEMLVGVFITSIGFMIVLKIIQFH